MKKRILPDAKFQFTDANLFRIHDYVVFTGTPSGSASLEQQKCGRNGATWAAKGEGSLVHQEFYPICFVGSDMDARGAGNLKDFFPTQHNPAFYGQYIDIWDMHTWTYRVTLRMNEASQFRGTHHICQDPMSSLILMDART